MKVLIYAPLAVLGHHFETDLELAQNHLDKGDEVYFLKCDEALKELGFMGCKGLLRCSLCTSRCNEGVSLLSNTSNLQILSIGSLEKIPLPEPIDLTQMDAIKKYEYKNNDIGSAYLSSLISDLRNPKPDLVKHQRFTKESLERLQGLVDRLEKTIDQIQPDLVYFFNGRFTLYRPLLRICQQKDIPFYVHERGSKNALYSLTKDNMPHDIATKLSEMESAWSATREEDRVSIASGWYENRAKGDMGSWRSFTADQNSDLLPDEWDFKKRNISFFISSEDEFTSVPGWEMTLFSSQADAIKTICDRFSSNPQIRFYVRMHPNLRGLDNYTTREFHSFAKTLKNCTIIEPESPVSTYFLLQNSEKVISFGSTVGVEATYWKKPSILIGKSYYGALGAAYVAQDKEDVFKLVEAQDLAPASLDAALKYGLWASTFGVQFEHYKPINLTTGKFKGHSITGAKPVMAMNYFFTFISDFRKVMKGEYSFWHLQGKIKNKLSLLKKH